MMVGLASVHKRRAFPPTKEHVTCDAKHLSSWAFYTQPNPASLFLVHSFVIIILVKKNKKLHSQYCLELFAFFFF